MTRVDDLCKLSSKGYATSMVVTNHNKKARRNPLVFFFVCLCDEACLFVTSNMLLNALCCACLFLYCIRPSPPLNVFATRLSAG